MTGDIVITLTIKPLKGGKRPVIVSAAPVGEMPLILTGHFPDRIALIDSAFEQMLTRKPKLVKVAADKKVAGKKKAEPTEFPDEPAPRKCRICGCTDAQACAGGCTWIGDDLCSNCEDKALEQIKADQLVRSETAEGLPEIEGDDEPDAETEADELEDPDDRNAPSAQPDPDEGDDEIDAAGDAKQAELF